MGYVSEENLMFEFVENTNAANIKVVGVGGGGGNAINTMIQSGLSNVDFIVANTDMQAIGHSLAETKLQIGNSLTKGLGAGANPEIGREAALEDRDKIAAVLAGADMVFITAGMGGGTGTGAAPVIAEIAREVGALAIGVVTKPFMFEGRKRKAFAESGIKELKRAVDTLITIPNQRLINLAGEQLSMLDSFKKVDEVLLKAVRGISDLITVPGLINLDFADVKTIMNGQGMAMMGTGEAEGQSRAKEAAQRAISSPLLEDVDVSGATGVLMNITASSSLTLHEVNDAAMMIHEAAHEEANIIFGAVIDEKMEDRIRLTVIATGFDRHDMKSMDPTQTFERLEIRSSATTSFQSAPMEEKTVVEEKPTHIEVKLDEQSLTTPFFQNRELDSNEFKKRIKELGLDDHTDDEYDIPTFLRKQVD
jgi:cell division protein FtsZ